MKPRRVALERLIVLHEGEQGINPQSGRLVTGPYALVRARLSGVVVDIEGGSLRHLPPLSFWHRGTLWRGGMARADFWLDGPPDDDGWASLQLAWPRGVAGTLVNDPLRLVTDRRARDAVRTFFGFAAMGRPDESDLRVERYAKAVDAAIRRGRRTTQVAIQMSMLEQPDPAQMSKDVKLAGYRGWADFVRSRHEATSA